MEANGITYPAFQNTLGTITQTEHWRIEGEIQAYEPYVREMRIWADLFSTVNIFTPLTSQPVEATLSPYERENINFRFVRYETRVFFLAPLIRLVQLPVVIF